MKYLIVLAALYLSAPALAQELDSFSQLPTCEQVKAGRYSKKEAMRMYEIAFDKLDAAMVKSNEVGAYLYQVKRAKLSQAEFAKEQAVVAKRSENLLKYMGHLGTLHNCVRDLR